MDRHFRCPCGGTAWVSRDDGCVTIECTACGATASAETLTLAREEWTRQVRRPAENRKRRDP